MKYASMCHKTNILHVKQSNVLEIFKIFNSACSARYQIKKPLNIVHFHVESYFYKIYVKLIYFPEQVPRND